MRTKKASASKKSRRRRVSTQTMETEPETKTRPEEKKAQKAEAGTFRPVSNSGDSFELFGEVGGLDRRRHRWREPHDTHLDISRSQIR